MAFFQEVTPNASSTLMFEGIAGCFTLIAVLKN